MNVSQMQHRCKQILELPRLAALPSGQTIQKHLPEKQSFSARRFQTGTDLGIGSDDNLGISGVRITCRVWCRFFVAGRKKRFGLGSKWSGLWAFWSGLGPKTRGLTHPDQMRDKSSSIKAAWAGLIFCLAILALNQAARSTSGNSAILPLFGGHSIVNVLLLIASASTSASTAQA